MFKILTTYYSFKTFANRSVMHSFRIDFLLTLKVCLSSSFLLLPLESLTLESLMVLMDFSLQIHKEGMVIDFSTF